jgi:hypothetical protein
MIAILLAVVLSAQQAFDCISTNLVISKGRGHEGNGLMAKWMGLTGQWWWMIKLPLVAYVWWLAIMSGGSRIVIAFLIVAIAVYAWVLWNNYKIAWRQG